MDNGAILGFIMIVLLVWLVVRMAKRINRRVKKIERKQMEAQRQRMTITIEQRKQARDIERHEKQLRKHEEQIAQHERRIADLEYKMAQAEADIAHWNEQANALYALLDVEQERQMRAAPGSKTDIQCQKRIITLNNQIHTAETRLNKAKHVKQMAEAEIEASA